MKKYCYVTLITNNKYVPGAILLKMGLDRVKAKYPLLCLVTKDLDEGGRKILRECNIEFRDIENIPTPDNIMAHNLKINKHRALIWKDVLTKFQIFKLEEFDKIIFLDADILINRNVDHCFELPHMTAALDGEYSNLWPLYPHFNTGFVVIEPSTKLFDDIINNFIPNIDLSKVVNFAGKEYILADQEILNLYYSNWPNEKEKHLNKYYNVFPPHCPESCIDDLMSNAYFFHFVGMKPWDVITPENYPIQETLSICALDLKEHKRCDIFYEIAYTLIQLGYLNRGKEINWEEIEANGLLDYCIALKSIDFFLDYKTADMYIMRALSKQPHNLDYFKLKKKIDEMAFYSKIKPAVLEVLKGSLQIAQETNTPSLDLFYAIDIISKVDFDTVAALNVVKTFWRIMQKSIMEYITDVYKTSDWDKLMYQ